MYDRLLLYFRLARLTPYLAAYCIRDCRYRMSCVILLLMRDRAPFWVCWCRDLTIPYEGSVLLLFYLLLLALLFNMYCSSTRCSLSCGPAALKTPGGYCIIEQYPARSGGVCAGPQTAIHPVIGLGRPLHERTDLPGILRHPAGRTAACDGLYRAHC